MYWGKIISAKHQDMLLEIQIRYHTTAVSLKLDEIYNADGEKIETVNHAMMEFSFPCEYDFPKNSLIRLPVQNPVQEDTAII